MNSFLLCFFLRNLFEIWFPYQIKINSIDFVSVTRKIKRDILTVVEIYLNCLCSFVHIRLKSCKYLFSEECLETKLFAQIKDACLVSIKSDQTPRPKIVQELKFRP